MNSTMRIELNVSATAFSRRRAGLLAAHAASNCSLMSSEQRILPFASKYGTSRITLPSGHVAPGQFKKAASSDSSSCHSINSISLEELELQVSIPSLDRKAQTMLHLEGRQFLHSSMTCPIQPMREPSNPNLCPSYHSRAAISMDELELQASIPSLDLKAHTMLNLEGRQFLHSSMTCPIQPLREPSNPNLCPSLRCTRTSISLEEHEQGVVFVEAFPEICGAPTSFCNSKQPLRVASTRSMLSLATVPSCCPSTSSKLPDEISEEDDDILSEEEIEDDAKSEQVPFHQDITMDIPLLSPPQTYPSLQQATEVLALKKCLMDLGQRIEAIEAQQQQGQQGQQSVAGSLKDLAGHLTDALQQVGNIDGVTCCNPPPSKKSKSRGQPAIGSKADSGGSFRGCDSLPELAPTEKSKSRSSSSKNSNGRKSKGRRSGRSLSDITKTTRAHGARSAEAPHRSSKRSTSKESLEVPTLSTTSRSRKAKSTSRTVRSTTRCHSATRLQQRPLHIGDLYNPNTSHGRLQTRSSATRLQQSYRVLERPLGSGDLYNRNTSHGGLQTRSSRIMTSSNAALEQQSLVGRESVSHRSHEKLLQTQGAKSEIDVGRFSQNQESSQARGAKLEGTKNKTASRSSGSKGRRRRVVKSRTHQVDSDNQ